MLRSLSDNLLAPLALAGSLVVVAALLHALLMWRERLRPGALALLPLSGRRQRPDRARVDGSLGQRSDGS